MSNVFSRRDFLKLSALVPGALAARPLISFLNHEAEAANPHVFIFVFDAWSARHMSIFGYPRRTMPNLERFAERCIVYHNHYAAGSFTLPGTASLLTGMYPWKHRALLLSAAGVADFHIPHNIFNVAAGSRYTLGYSQNPFADMFLHQFGKWLDEHIPSNRFNAERHQLYSLPVVRNDGKIAFEAFDNKLFLENSGLDGSLFVEFFFRLGVMRRQAVLREQYHRLYPKGMPFANEYFLLDQTIDGALGVLKRLDSPALGYFHFYPPHTPYTPTEPFAHHFEEDGWVAPDKPFHPLSLSLYSYEELRQARLSYDQYLASWDAELARLLDYLETSGLLDKSIVVITSDHGELFERGEIGHSTFLLSEPVVRIPLFISLPGQRQRADIYTPTSNVDILPTLAHQTGADIPAWVEGRLLPGLGGVEEEGRSVYAFDAQMQSVFKPLSKFSISLTRDGHKLVYYQYPKYSAYEFFDLVNDSEELTNLYPRSPRLARQMQQEIMAKLAEIASQS